MKKLFTLFTVLLLCTASSWAQFSPRSDVEYSMKCHNGDANHYIGISGGNISGKCSDGNRAILVFEATEGGYYIKVTNAGNKYFNWVNNQPTLSANPSTVWVFRAPYIAGAVALAPSGTASNKALNDNVTNAPYLQMGQFTGSGNTHSHWYIREEGVVKNEYIGTSETIGETEWKDMSNWSFADYWNVGPGYTNSNMWSPINLNGVTATDISFEGWNLCIKLVNSSLTATAKKLQAGNNATSQFDVDQDSKLNLTLSGTNLDGGTKVYNIDGSLTIKTRANHFTGSGTNTVNLGTTGSFTFTADAAVTIGNSAPFTLNATLPAEYTEESRTLATFINVTVSSLNVNIDGTGGWTQVASQAALQQQFFNGKYYYVDIAPSGVTLYTFRETRRKTHTVTSDATLRQIASYDNYDSFIVNSDATLTVDVKDFDLTRITGEGNIILNADAPISGGTVSGSLTVNEGKSLTVMSSSFDLTRISGAGNVVLDVDASLTGNKSTAVTGRLTVNSGVTLTIGGGESETNSVASFTSINLLGEIYHKNSVATLNNVTVPAEATGIIYSFDMGKAADGFRLAGTTTVEGTLYVCNKWNFQMKVDQITGSGTWTICGTTDSDFNASGTSSNEAATINVADSPSFTGTVNMNSTNATTNVNGTFMAGSGKLAGFGTLRLLTFPTTSSGPNLTDWTGTVEFPAVDTDKGNLTDIFNAWGNTGSTIKLNNVKGHLFKGKTVNPVLNLAGTLEIVNGYSGEGNPNPVLRKVTGAGTLALTWNNGKNYCIEITELSDFTGTLQGHAVKDSYIRINVGKYTVASAPSVGEKLFNASGDVTLQNLYKGLQQTTAYTWTLKTVGDVSGFYVESVDQVKLARDVANEKISHYNIGTGIGKYTVRLNNVDYTDIKEVEDAILAWDNTDEIPVTFTINQPTSAFYRLKAGSQYLQDVRKSSDATQRMMTSEDGANTAAKTLFYLDGDKFVGYQTGYGFGYSVCQTQNTKELNSVLFTESSEVGKYTIQSQQGTCTSASYNTGYWGVDGNELSRKDNVAAGANWTLETVTSIPVTFKTAGLGYATFNSPVAVQIPEDTKAYVCKIGTDGNTLTFYEITSVVDESGEKTIPANTPVLLYNSTVKDAGSDVTVSFPVTTIDTEITNNSFVGTLATEAFSTSDSEKDTYSLRTNTIEGVTKVGFYKKTSGTTLAGFKAWLQTAHQDQARNFTIYFNGEDDATGIAEALGLDSDKVEIYDLSGRKLSGYQKGINIVNGKKIFK